MSYQLNLSAEGPDMAETWRTERRCHDCLTKGNTVYLDGQAWGKDEEGRDQFRLSCNECGHTEVTRWSGR